MRSWVQSLMDECVNVCCINLVYKHVHHGEWCKKNVFTKLNKKLNP
jgi:hypothetical protein